MIELANLVLETGTVAVLTLILFRVMRLEKDAQEFDGIQRDISKSVANISGRLQAIEHVAFPAMVREKTKEDLL